MQHKSGCVQFVKFGKAEDGGGDGAEKANII